MSGMRAAVAMALTLTACQMGPVNYAGTNVDARSAKIGGSIGADSKINRPNAGDQKQETQADLNYSPGFGTQPSAKP